MPPTQTSLDFEQAPLIPAEAPAGPVFRAPEPREPNPDSQCGKILAALRKARGTGANEGFVTMPALVDLSGSFNIHSRIDELRSSFGIQIENDTDYSVKPHKSKYRLVGQSPVALPL